MKLNFNGLLNVLPDAVTGWINVFIVIAAIIVTVVILNKVTSKKED